MREEPTNLTTFSEPPARDIMSALLRGTALKCPACGQGMLYRQVPQGRR